MRLLSIGLCLALAACAGTKVVSQSPRSITVAVGGVSGSEQEAADLAEAHCQREGLHARRAGTTRAGFGVNVTFDCVP